MNTGWKKAVAAALGVSLAMCVLAGCSSKEEPFDTEATAMTINGEEVSAGELNFVAHYVQSQYQYTYDYYYGDNSFSYEIYSGYTVGDMMKEQTLEYVEEMILARQHADEYGVSLTDEEKAAITEAAEAFLEANDEDILEKMSATKETVEEYLTLETLEQKMEPAMTADVDTEVSDEEAAQRRIRYVLIPAETEESDEEDEEEIEVTDEDETEEETEDPAWTAAMDEAYAKAEEVISLIDDGMDFDDALEQVDDSLSSHETTFGADNATVSDELVTYTDGLPDETLVTTPIEASTGYYVAYVVNELDREATDEEIESIIEDRIDDAITDLFSIWADEAEVETDDDVIATVVYDYNLYVVYDEDEDETDWYEDETDLDEEETDWDEEETDLDEEETDLDEAETDPDEDETSMDEAETDEQ